MSVSFSVKTSGLDELDRKIAELASKQEKRLANEVLKDTDPFVPALTGSLSQRAHVKGDSVVYPGPYARYLYYGKVMVDAETGRGPDKFLDKNGNVVIRFRKGSHLTATDKDLVYTKSMHPNAQSHWFEASKAQNLKKWLKGVEKIGK